MHVNPNWKAPTTLFLNTSCGTLKLSGVCCCRGGSSINWSCLSSCPETCWCGLSLGTLNYSLSQFGVVVLLKTNTIKQAKQNNRHFTAAKSVWSVKSKRDLGSEKLLPPPRVSCERSHWTSKHRAALLFSWAAWNFWCADVDRGHSSHSWPVCPSSLGS